MPGDSAIRHASRDPRWRSGAAGGVPVHRCRRQRRCPGPGPKKRGPPLRWAGWDAGSPLPFVRVAVDVPLFVPPGGQTGTRAAGQRLVATALRSKAPLRRATESHGRLPCPPASLHCPQQAAGFGLHLEGLGATAHPPTQQTSQRHMARVARWKPLVRVPARRPRSRPIGFSRPSPSSVTLQRHPPASRASQTRGDGDLVATTASHHAPRPILHGGSQYLAPSFRSRPPLCPALPFLGDPSLVART